MAEYIISDTHFGHGNIIELGKRPFENVQRMNDLLIEKWNSRVTPRDTVYHLGDFGWKNTEYNLDILSRLRFKKLVLVCGNHDSAKTLRAFDQMGVQIQDYLEVATPKHNIRLCMFHYPLLEWNGFYRGAIHAHGHTHSKIFSEFPGRYNVCVEAIGYAPKSLATLETEHVEAVRIPQETRDGHEDHPRN